MRLEDHHTSPKNLEITFYIKLAKYYFLSINNFLYATSEIYIRVMGASDEIKKEYLCAENDTSK